MQLFERFNGFLGSIAGLSRISAYMTEISSVFMFNVTHSNFSTYNFVKSSRYVVYLDTIP